MILTKDIRDVIILLNQIFIRSGENYENNVYIVFHAQQRNCFPHR